MGWFLPKLADSLHRNGSRDKRIHRKPLRQIIKLRDENSSVPSNGANLPDAMRISKPIKDSNNPSKAMTNKYETKPSSKPSVKGWMKRVLRKENPTAIKSDRGSNLFRKRNRIRKTKNNDEDGPSSPMNTRTMATESSSQYCNSRSDESPHRELLTVQINDAYRCPNLPSNDVYQVEKNQIIESKMCESNLPLTPISSETSQENLDKIQLPKFTFERSEVIAKLFPMGYPSSQAIENYSDAEITIDFMADDDEEDTYEHIDLLEERPAEEERKSPFLRSEIVTALFPMGHPDSRQKRKENDDSVHSDSESISQSSEDRDCDKFIGLIISFDPTWDLLTPEPEDTTIVRSRLKKFHEIENYADSILGKFAGEESSEEESMELLDGVNLSFGSESLNHLPFSAWKEENKSPTVSFELGYHFDNKRFALHDTAEVEICFDSDDSSVEYNENCSVSESCHSSRAMESPLKIRQEFEILSDSEGSRDGLHIDEADSSFSVGGKIFVNDSFDSDCNPQSPIHPFFKTPKLHSLSFLSSPQQKISPTNVFLFTDKDDNDHTECESSSTTSTQMTPIQLQPIKSLCLPKFGSPRLSSSSSNSMIQKREVRDLRF